jgi:hypothetical protein
MQRLGVDEGPVEIEYDGANHARTMLATPGLALEVAAVRSAARKDPGFFATTTFALE